MRCPRNGVILRLLSGELEPGARRELLHHLQACSACRSAYENLQASWDALGDWLVEVPAINLTERVLAEADDPDRGEGRAPRRAAHRTVLLRAAASIVLAVGLGVGAGYLVPAGKSVGIPAPSPALEDISEALEWIGVASESATGLPFGLEPDEAPEGGDTP
jgi:anti-sigma factor RsiW